MRIKQFVIGLVVGALGIAANATPQPAVSWDTTQVSTSESDAGKAWFNSGDTSGIMLSWAFKTGAGGATVAAVGVYDHMGTTLAAQGPFKAAIYKVNIDGSGESGTLVAGSDASIASTDTLFGGYRWVDLASPVTLDANTIYVMASWSRGGYLRGRYGGTPEVNGKNNIATWYPGAAKNDAAIKLLTNKDDGGGGLMEGALNASFEFSGYGFGRYRYSSDLSAGGWSNAGDGAYFMANFSPTAMVAGPDGAGVLILLQ